MTSTHPIVLSIALAVLITLVAALLNDAFVLPTLAMGFAVTMVITVLSAFFALVLAMSTGLLRVYGHLLISHLCIIYVELFRGTSLLVQLFWFFFVLPFVGIRLSPGVVAVLSLSLNLGAYGSEVVRGALMAVPRGQWDACHALQLPFITTVRQIILPQAVPMMLPTFGNEVIELMKYSAVVSLISVRDLTARARGISDTGVGPLVGYALALLSYLIIALLLKYTFNKLTCGVGRSWRIKNG